MKYKVRMMESERGWGQKHWNEYFDTPEAAAKYWKEMDDQNEPGPAPDYYIQPIGAIEVVSDEVAIADGYKVRT